MINDHVSDMIARLKNAQRANHKSADVTPSKLNKGILEVLKSEGLIESFELAGEGMTKAYRVSLKYFSSGRPVISRAERVSKPGCRRYSSFEDLGRVKSGLGISILSTSKGVMADHQARKMRVGGEVLALFG
jgi:small subunit ribosomal protein S8